MPDEHAAIWEQSSLELDDESEIDALIDAPRLPDVPKAKMGSARGNMHMKHNPRAEFRIIVGFGLSLVALLALLLRHTDYAHKREIGQFAKLDRAFVLSTKNGSGSSNEMERLKLQLSALSLRGEDIEVIYSPFSTDPAMSVPPKTSTKQGDEALRWDRRQSNKARGFKRLIHALVDWAEASDKRHPMALLLEDDAVVLPGSVSVLNDAIRALEVDDNGVYGNWDLLYAAHCGECGWWADTLTSSSTAQIGGGLSTGKARADGIEEYAANISANPWCGQQAKPTLRVVSLAPTPRPTTKKKQDKAAKPGKEADAAAARPASASNAPDAPKAGSKAGGSRQRRRRLEEQPEQREQRRKERRGQRRRAENANQAERAGSRWSSASERDVAIAIEKRTVATISGDTAALAYAVDPRCSDALVVRYTPQLGRLLVAIVDDDPKYAPLLERQFDLSLARMSAAKLLRSFVIWPPVVHRYHDGYDRPDDGYGMNSSQVITSWLKLHTEQREESADSQRDD